MYDLLLSYIISFVWLEGLLLFYLLLLSCVVVAVFHFLIFCSWLLSLHYRILSRNVISVSSTVKLILPRCIIYTNKGLNLIYTGIILHYWGLAFLVVLSQPYYQVFSEPLGFHHPVKRPWRYKLGVWAWELDKVPGTDWRLRLWQGLLECNDDES